MCLWRDKLWERMNERKLFNIQQFLALFASRDCMWISPLHAHSTPIANTGVPVFCSLPLVPCTKSSLLGRKKCRGCCKCCYSQRKQPRPGLRLAQYAQGTAATLLTALQTRQELSSVQPPKAYRERLQRTHPQQWPPPLLSSSVCGFQFDNQKSSSHSTKVSQEKYSLSYSNPPDKQLQPLTAQLLFELGWHKKG